MSDLHTYSTPFLTDWIDIEQQLISDMFTELLLKSFKNCQSHEWHAYIQVNAYNHDCPWLAEMKLIRCKPNSV